MYVFNIAIVVAAQLPGMYSLSRRPPIEDLSF